MLTQIFATEPLKLFSYKYYLHSSNIITEAYTDERFCCQPNH
jgi:hypothetical protein